MLGFPATDVSNVANAIVFQIKAFRHELYLTRVGNTFALAPQQPRNDPQSAINMQLFFFVETELDVKGQDAFVNIPELNRTFNNGLNYLPITVSKGRLYNLSFFLDNKKNQQQVIAEDFNVLDSTQDATTRNCFLLPWIEPEIADQPFIATSIVFETLVDGLLKRLFWRINPVDSDDNGLGLQIFSRNPADALTPEASQDMSFYWEIETYPLNLSVFEQDPFAQTNVARLLTPTDSGTLQNVFAGANLNLISINPFFPAKAVPYNFSPSTVQPTTATGAQAHTLSAAVGIPQFLADPCPLDIPVGHADPVPYGPQDQAYQMGIYSQRGQLNTNPLISVVPWFNPDSIHDWSMTDWNINQFTADAQEVGIPKSLINMFPIQFQYLDDPTAIGGKSDIFNIVHVGDPTCQFILARTDFLGSFVAFKPSGGVGIPVNPPYGPEEAFLDANAHLVIAPSHGAVVVGGFPGGPFRGAVNPTVWKALDDPLEQVDRTNYALTWRVIPTVDTPPINLQQMDFAFGGGRTDVAEDDTNNFFQNRLFFPWINVAIASTDSTQLLCVNWINSVTFNQDYRLNWVEVCTMPGSVTTNNQRDSILNVVMQFPSPYVKSWFAARYNLDQVCAVPQAADAPQICHFIKDEFGDPLLRQSPFDRTVTIVNQVSDPKSGATFGEQLAPTTDATDMYMQAFCNSRVSPTDVPSCSCLFPKPSGIPGLLTGRDFCFSSICWSGLGYLSSGMVDNRAVCNSQICIQALSIEGSAVFFRGEQTLSCNGTVTSLGTQPSDAPVTGTVSDTVGPSTSTYTDGEFQLVVGFCVALILLVLGTLLVVVVVRKSQST